MILKMAGKIGAALVPESVILKKYLKNNN